MASLDLRDMHRSHSSSMTGSIPDDGGSDQNAILTSLPRPTSNQSSSSQSPVNDSPIPTTALPRPVSCSTHSPINTSVAPSVPLLVHRGNQGSASHSPLNNSSPAVTPRSGTAASSQSTKKKSRTRSYRTRLLIEICTSALQSRLLHFLSLFLIAFLILILRPSLPFQSAVYVAIPLVCLVYLIYHLKPIIFEVLLMQDVLLSQIISFDWYNVVDDNLLLGGMPLYGLMHGEELLVSSWSDWLEQTHFHRPQRSKSESVPFFDAPTTETECRISALDR